MARPCWLLAELAVKAALIYGTNMAAAKITERLGNKEHRTTNAMPYPEHFQQETVDKFKSNYADCQVWASICAVTDEPSLAFAPLYGIQLAALLMTLVRKGKIGTVHYHGIYTAALFVPYIVLTHIVLVKGRFDILFLMNLFFVFQKEARRRCASGPANVLALVVALPAVRTVVNTQSLPLVKLISLFDLWRSTGWKCWTMYVLLAGAASLGFVPRSALSP